ncbi:MAG: ABC transporter substrate-binding protein [Nitritalea sp.]
MQISLAIEWFLNPDHLPLLVADQKGFFQEAGVSNFNLIVPEAHYDGLEELIQGKIQFATNEPLHLIEQYDDAFLSLGTYFQTKGGVIMKAASLDALRMGEKIRVATPVSNEKTNRIGLEIIQRYAAKEGIHVGAEQVAFIAKDFYLIQHMEDGFDAGWLYFYNFEGVEAKHKGLDVVFMDCDTAGFANFCGLDLFTSKTFYKEQPELVHGFVDAVKKAIRWIHDNPKEAATIYYAYMQEEPSALTDDILVHTARCFDPEFASSFEKELPILHFFNEIGITNLEESRFKTAFLA